MTHTKANLEITLVPHVLKMRTAFQIVMIATLDTRWMITDVENVIHHSTRRHLEIRLVWIVLQTQFVMD
jgi:hypothetical protein